MIDDDATPEDLEAWYRRTPDEIAAAKQAKWNADWAALRLPDDEAYEADRSDAPPPVAETGEAVDASTRRLPGGWTLDNGQPIAPKVDILSPSMRALNDAIAAGERSDYDMMYTPNPKTGWLRIPKGPDGQPLYGLGHPYKDPTTRSKGSSHAAGRYQFQPDTWGRLQAKHDDLIGYWPVSQDKGAWYNAAETYYANKATRGRDLAEDARDPGRWPAIATALRGQWSSLPGGSQSRMTQAQFNQLMIDGLRKYAPQAASSAR